jgi:hypothetical protein
MLNDDQLGAALTKRLRELVRDIEPSPELIDSVNRHIRGSRATGRSKLSRRLRTQLIAVVVPALAAVITVLILLSGSTVTSSFAVTRTPGGAILVTIREIAGVTGANTRLRDLGVPVTIVPITTDCSSRLDLTYMAIGTEPETTIRIIPAEIPADTTVVLGAEQLSTGKIEMAIGRVTGGPPSCVAPGHTGPGLPGSTSPTNEPVGPSSTTSTAP